MPSSDLVQGFNVLQFSLLPFGANLLCLNYSRLSVFIVVHPSLNLNLNLYPCVNVVVVYVHPPSPYPCDLLCVICSFLAGTSPCVYISGRFPSVGSGTVGSAYFS